jgi:hypothetical protein
VHQDQSVDGNQHHRATICSAVPYALRPATFYASHLSQTRFECRSGAAVIHSRVKIPSHCTLDPQRHPRCFITPQLVTTNVRTVTIRISPPTLVSKVDLPPTSNSIRHVPKLFSCP